MKYQRRTLSPFCGGVAVVNLGEKPTLRNVLAALAVDAKLSPRHTAQVTLKNGLRVGMRFEEYVGAKVWTSRLLFFIARRGAAPCVAEWQIAVNNLGDAYRPEVVPAAMEKESEGWRYLYAYFVLDVAPPDPAPPGPPGLGNPGGGRRGEGEE